MPLSPDQDDLLKQNLMAGFGAPAAQMPPMDGVGFDVSAMGPNLADTVKSPPSAPPVPAPTPEPPLGGATGSWEPEPTPKAIQPPPQPPRSTPTGAPYTPPENPKIGDSHPGLGDDELKKYLEAQRGQIDKYGPDQEKAVIDRIKAQQGSFGHVAEGALKKASDDIMQGVARAGSKDSFGQFQAKDQNDIKNAMAQNEMLHKDNMTDIGAKQGLDAMDSKSTLGKAMLNTWGPLLTKLGVPPDQQAKMIPSLISSMTPELTKHEDAMAKIQAAKMQRDGMTGIRRDNEQDKLESQARQTVTNLRGDMSLRRTEEQRDAAIQAYNTIDRIKQEKRMPSQIEYYDILGQMWKARTGAAPTDQAIRDLDARTFKGDLGKAVQYITGKPAGRTTAEVLQNVQDFAKQSGEQSDKLHEGYMASHHIKPAGLDDSRWAPIVSQARGLSFKDATQSSSGAKPDTQDSEAVMWARSNPTDPRAARILKANGL